jgi:aryl-alcohol dehydrogenase-like predicted oxidoreductase
LARLRQEGKIRAIGVSNFGAADLKDWLDAGECVSDQLGYNLLFRAVERAILPACERSGVGVLTYMPLLQGILTHRWKTIEEIPPLRRRTRHFSSERSGTRHGEPGCEELLLRTLDELDAVAQGIGRSLADVALAWLMAQPAVTSVMIGARNAAQLLRNTAAVDLELDDATLLRLDEITIP